MTQMDEAAKRRLVGAAVLVALAVIFVPMLVEESDDDEFGEPIVIPEPPAFELDANDAADAERMAADSAWPGSEGQPKPLPTPEPPSAAVDAPPPVAPAPQSAPEPQSQPAPAPRTTTKASESSPEPESKSRPAPAESAPSADPAAGPKPVPDGVRAWVIQVASLRSAEAARALQEQLRAMGYPAFVEQAQVQGQRYYRVRVGPEVERARADRLAERIAGDTNSQPLVQRYP
jgi:DedD protein